MAAVYFVDFSCDGTDCPDFPQVYGQAEPKFARFTGTSWPDCYSQARKSGWLVADGGKGSLCPACVTAKRSGAAH